MSWEDDYPLYDPKLELNYMTLSEVASVVKAAEQGKTIQYQHRHYPDVPWSDISITPTSIDGFNFQAYNYRVKPEKQKWLIKGTQLYPIPVNEKTPINYLLDSGFTLVQEV